MSTGILSCLSNLYHLLPLVQFPSDRVEEGQRRDIWHLPGRKEGLAGRSGDAALAWIGPAGQVQVLSSGRVPQPPSHLVGLGHSIHPGQVPLPPLMPVLSSLSLPIISNMSPPATGSAASTFLSLPPPAAVLVGIPVLSLEPSFTILISRKLMSHLKYITRISLGPNEH